MDSNLQVGWRPYRRNDAELMLGWLTQPHVARWWDEEEERTLASVAEKYDPASDDNHHPRQVVIEVAEGNGPTTAVGWLQWYRLDEEPTWAPGWPHPRNERAVRAYAGVGFRDTGVDLVDPEAATEVRRLMIATVEPGVGITR